jgi:hypothetical protein
MGSTEQEALVETEADCVTVVMPSDSVPLYSHHSKNSCPPSPPSSLPPSLPPPSPLPPFPLPSLDEQETGKVLAGELHTTLAKHPRLLGGGEEGRGRSRKAALREYKTTSSLAPGTQVDILIF